MSDCLNKKMITYSKKSVQRSSDASVESPTAVLSASFGGSQCLSVDATSKSKTGTLHAYLHRLPPSVGVKRKIVRMLCFFSLFALFQTLIAITSDASFRMALFTLTLRIKSKLTWFSSILMLDKKMRLWQCAKFVTCTIREVLLMMNRLIASSMTRLSMELIGRLLLTSRAVGTFVCLQRCSVVLLCLSAI